MRTGSPSSETSIEKFCVSDPSEFVALTDTLLRPTCMADGVHWITPVPESIVIPVGYVTSEYVGAGNPVASTSYV